jgi:hypothetical protein
MPFMKRFILNLLHVLLTVPLGFALLMLIAAIFDAMEWGGFNSFALAHGTMFLRYQRVCWLRSSCLLRIAFIRRARPPKPAAEH